MKMLNVLFAAVVVALASCDEVFNENIEGTGPKVSRTLSVGDFDEIDVSHAMEVFIRQGEKQSVVVKSQRNILNRFTAKVRSGRLELELEQGNYRDVDIMVYITVPSIKYIGASGASKVEMSAFSAMKDLELDFSGATEFKALGEESQLDRLVVDISGAGKLEAFLLKSRRMDLDVSGASLCEVYATEVLNLDISGASKVSYKGNPKIKQEVSGASSVQAAN